MKRTRGLLLAVLGLVAMLTLGGVLVALFGGQLPQPVAQQPYPVGTAVSTTVKATTATPQAPAYPGPATPVTPAGPATPLSTPPFTPPPAGWQPTPTRIVVPTPAKPAQAETYVAREIVVAKVGSGPGEIGVFHGAPELQKAGPESLAVDKEGNVYILDTVNLRTVVFDSKGSFLRVLPGVTGMDICVDAAGAIYVLERLEVAKKFDREGKLVQEYPVLPGMQAGDISLDAHGYLLASSGFNTILLGTTEGVFTPEQQSASKKQGRLCRAGAYSGYFFTSEEEKTKTGSFQVEVPADELRQTERRLFALPIESDRPLIAIAFFDVDGAGNAYLIVRLQEKQGDDYILLKEMRKYTPQGQLVAQFLLPRYTYVSAYHGTVVDELGNVYQLLASKDEVKVIQWQRE